MLSPSIWYPPQMPRICALPACCSSSQRSKCCARIHCKSKTVFLLPGRITRSNCRRTGALKPERAAQVLEVGEIGDAGKLEDCDRERALRQRLPVIEGDAVFFVERQVVDVWEHPDARLVRLLFENAYGVAEKARIAAKAIHSEGADEKRFFGIEQRDGSVDRCEDPAAIDI